MKNKPKIDIKTLNNKEELLRDGIFNLDTIRFGKIAEIMIKKIYNCEFSVGTTKYDLIENDEKIEVKFSRTREREEEINEENVLNVCINNATDNKARMISINENRDFDCNIQQIKPKEFDILYYGLFFSDQIAIFKLKKEELYDSFFMNQINKHLTKINGIKDVIESNKHSKYYIICNRFIKNKKSILNVTKAMLKELREIKENDGYEEEVANIKKGANELVDTIETINEKNYETICDESIEICKQILSIKERRLSLPSSSSKQHRGSKGEGQFHINKDTFEWHKINCLEKYVSYKELYELLK